MGVSCICICMGSGAAKGTHAKKSVKIMLNPKLLPSSPHKLSEPGGTELANYLATHCLMLVCLFSLLWSQGQFKAGDPRPSLPPLTAQPCRSRQAPLSPTHLLALLH